MKLKIGIIGLGIGEAHIQGYQASEHCEVVSLCDFSEEKLNLAREKFSNFRLTKQADDILDDPAIDVVSIASYDNYHYEQIIKAINNNKHIFVEKPLCLYKEQAQCIRSLLRAKPALKLSSNLILRMSPRFRYLKKMITEGSFGDFFYVEGDYNYGRLSKLTDGWRGKIGFYSVVYGGGVHIIDLLLWLVQDPIVEVKAFANNISSKEKFGYNDMVVCIFKFKNGVVGKMGVNMGCVFPHFHPLSVYGTKATFVNELDKGLLFKSRNKSDLPEEIEFAYPGVHKGDLIYSFIDSIVNGTQAEVTEEDVFRAMSVCFAIEEAVSTGNNIKVEYI